MSLASIQAATRTQAKLSYFAQLMGQTCMLTMICLAMTYPPISITSDLRLKMEDALLPVVLSIYIFLLLAGLARPIRFNGMFLIGVFFSFSVTMSMYYGSDVLQHRLLLRDYFEIPKAWFPVAFFTIAYEAGLSESSLRRLLTALSVPVLLVCMYGWAQFLNMPFAYRINSLYEAALHDEAALELYHRVYSTMGNANVLGQFLSWMIAAYTLAFLFRVGNRTLNLVVVFSCLITVVMTASRYGLLTAGLALLMILGMAMATGGRRLFPLLALVVLLPLFGWTYSYISTRYVATEQRFQELKHPLQVHSLRTRLDDLWVDAVQYFRQSPIVGHGPAKVIFTYVWTDSEFLNMLKFYGILGFPSYLALYLFPIYIIAKGLKAGQRAGPALEDQIPATYLMMRLGMIVGVTALVMNIGEFTYLNGGIMGLLWMWLGLGARCAKTIFAAGSTSSGAVPLARTARVFVQQPGLRTTP
jgi:O-antigen ligase